MTELLSKAAFKQYDPHCWGCGREIKHVKDVGDARVILPANRKQVLCMTCAVGGRPIPDKRV